MNEGTQLIAEKHSALVELLEEEYALVHLDPADDSVVLPAHLKCNSSVTLKLSRYFRGALEISDDLVEAELLFDNKYFKCIFPISSIWGITSFEGKNLVWPESTPEEVLKNLLEGHEGKAKGSDSDKESQPESKSNKRKHLRRVK